MDPLGSRPYFTSQYLYIKVQGSNIISKFMDPLSNRPLDSRPYFVSKFMDPLGSDLNLC